MPEENQPVADNADATDAPVDVVADSAPASKPAKKKTAARKSARVLVNADVFGVAVVPNDVVDLPGDVADQLQKEGVIDTHPDAVAYAVSTGAEVQVINP